MFCPTMSNKKDWIFVSFMGSTRSFSHVWLLMWNINFFPSKHIKGMEYMLKGYTLSAIKTMCDIILHISESLSIYLGVFTLILHFTGGSKFFTTLLILSFTYSFADGSHFKGKFMQVKLRRKGTCICIITRLNCYSKNTLRPTSCLKLIFT